MSDLRETVARALGGDAWRFYVKNADDAIAVARPVIERELLERLITEAGTFRWSVVEDKDGCTVPVDEWLRTHLAGPERSHMTTDTT